MPARAFSAVLLDIDGTLADTNYLHVDAWTRALEDVGRPVEAWRVHREIGKDSGRLLEALLGEDAVRLGERAKARHVEHYRRDRPRIRPFPGARAFLEDLAARGFRVVLASSAAPDEFEMLMAVLDPGDAVLTATTSADVREAKPAPDVVGVALEKAGAAPEEAVMIGDAVWDVESAARAGVRTVGVLSGGIGERALIDAGAIAVHRDVADLAAQLESSPLYGR